MWLLPIFSFVCKVAGRLFYRLTTSGPAIPATGPLLLVANHPNSLLDPVLVSAAAGRSVRFLAKAPLFVDPKIGWLIRASGAIPVYRRVDDPTAMGANEGMFDAVIGALEDGGAVGIFPEGTSHSGPGLVRLKTGAARIALGAASRGGARVKVVPVGLVHGSKETFRSEALVVVGEPVPWDDLVAAGDGDVEAVRALTSRIEAALRRVTLNTEYWEDRPLVECAEGIWASAHAPDEGPGPRVERLAFATRLLAAARRRGHGPALQVARRVERHARRLARLNLDPRGLMSDATASVGLSGAYRRLALLGLPALAVAALGWFVYLVPYQATRRVAELGRPEADQRSTYKLLYGAALYIVWSLALAGLAGVAFGPWIGLFSLGALPLVGYLGIRIRESWRGGWADVRRFLVVRSRSGLVERLRREQSDLAARLRDLMADDASLGDLR